MTRTYYAIEWTDPEEHDHELFSSSLEEAREMTHRLPSDCSWSIYRHKVSPIENSEGTSR